MTYPRMIALNWLALLLAALYSCQVMPSHAGVFIEGQLGASYMVSTVADGTWRQEAFGTSYQGVKLAYGGRIGWRFKQPYSVQIGLVSFGTNRTETDAVADQCYNHKSHTVLCNVQAMHLKTASTMRGYTLSVTRYVALGRDFSIPLSLGAAIVAHRLRTDDSYNPQFMQERYSRMPMWSIGAGLCWKDTLCWENTYYQAPAGQHYHDPTSEQVLTSLVGWRYHFGE